MPTWIISDALNRATAAARQAAIDNGGFVQHRPYDNQDPHRAFDNRPYGPQRFTWGAVQKVHRVGPYAIVEYLSNEQGSSFAFKDRAVTDRRAFSIFVDGYDVGHSYGSLDKALLACVAWRADERLGGRNRAANSRAATYMARMIELEED
jgi:hypothetical protein